MDTERSVIEALPVVLSAGLKECRCMAVDEQETTRHVRRRKTESFEAATQCGSVGILGRAETGITVTPETWAQGTAAGTRDRSQTRSALGLP